MFICPYCHTTLEPPLKVSCPHCGRIMRTPRVSKRKEVGRRLAAKRRIQLDAERQRKALGTGPALSPARRKIFQSGGALFILFVLGLALTSKTRNIKESVPGRGMLELRAEKALRVLRVGLEHFHDDTGRYPTEREGLLALITNPDIPNWQGPYVTLIKHDFWKTPYRYMTNDTLPTLRSAGPDRVFETADDLTPADWELLYQTTERIRRSP